MYLPPPPSLKPNYGNKKKLTRGAAAEERITFILCLNWSLTYVSFGGAAVVNAKPYLRHSINPVTLLFYYYVSSYNKLFIFLSS